MLVVAALLLVVLGMAVRGLRGPAARPRWPYLLASTLSGGAVLAMVVAMLIALGAGRHTWNTWVSGSGSSESATLWLVLIVGPVLLATCLALLGIGGVLRARQRGRRQP